MRGFTRYGGFSIIRVISIIRVVRLIAYLPGGQATQYCAALRYVPAVEIT